ncbi:MAG: 1-acyl-sn-glycerol-3-phosphate acyltransferase, partial [Planctomycetes bacterium]|nr:1-acyl-sn-glycerol-3-phosphate acyltransferase [Planctomycetota bacterium]
MTQDTTTAATYHYPPPGNLLMNLLRTGAAYGLLAFQLVFFLFVLEVPYWLADRFLARHRGNAFYRGQRGIIRWFFRLYPFGRSRLAGVQRKSFPSPCVIVANHQSMLDILMALRLPVNARWFVKPWVMKIPLMGELNQAARHIVVDDDEANPESPQGLEPALEWLGKGVSILAFPEGSRSPDGNLRRFKNGAFLLAVKAGVPVVPVVLDGTGACVRKGSFWVHPPDLHLRVLPPVASKGFEGELGAARLKAEVHSRMAAALAEIRAGKPRGVAWPHGVPARLAMAGLAVLLAAVTGLSIYVNNWCIATPPAFDGDRALKQQQVVERGEVRRLGPNWRRSRGGVHELAVSGSDWERGYANAML